MKIVDDAGKELPWDGETFGHLWVRGPGVVDSYLGGEGGDILDDQGFFHTGDVATIDAQGYMQITDRSKDVIKSGESGSHPSSWRTPRWAIPTSRRRR